MKWQQWVSAVCALALGAGISSVGAFAGTLLVPEDYPTIQDAIDAAAPGDTIRVADGEWCGATVDIQVELVGEDGATIVGCSDSPNLAGFMIIGFFLPDANASGTSIRHFVFDGKDVSDELPSGNFDPLSFAVFAREANNVSVDHNTIYGTVQAITNTGGSGWTVTHNDIHGLTVFTCSGVPPCGGGDGIVFQERDVLGPRATSNMAAFNTIQGTVPDALALFDMVGIILFGQDGAVVQNNKITIPDNPSAAGNGLGIVVADTCCGSGNSFLTSINSMIVKNDGRGSEAVVVIDLDSGGGTGNTVGTVLRGNLGENDINGISSSVMNRSFHTLIEFP